MRAWQATVQDEAGNVIFNPLVTVYQEDGATLADIFNEDGSPKENPFTGTIEGFAQFWADRGTYKVVGANGGVSETWQVDLADEEALSIAQSAKLAAGVIPQQFGGGGGGWQVEINAAIESVSSSGGGGVVLPPMDYEINGPIIIRDNVTLDAGQSVISLSDGSNCDMVMTPNFYEMTGTNNYTPGTPHGFGIIGGIWDGNYSNQSPIDPDTCNGFALYGYGYLLRDVRMRNIRGNGIRSEWGQFGEAEFGMETQYDNIRIDFVGRHGMWHRGPHDSNHMHIIIIDASQEQDATYDGVLCEGFSGVRWYNPHIWHRASRTNRCRWAANFNGGAHEIFGGHFEGARRQLRATGNIEAHGVAVYAPNSNDPQIEVSGARNFITARCRTNNDFPRPVMLGLGLTAPVENSRVDIQVQAQNSGPTNPCVQIDSSLGNNRVAVRSTGYQSSSYITGTWDNFDEVSLSQEFPNFFRQGQVPLQYSTTAFRPASPLRGQVHFDTTLGRPIWWNGSAWVDATGTTV